MEKADHPSQIQLRAFLDDAALLLAPSAIDDNTLKLTPMASVVWLERQSPGAETVSSFAPVHWLFHVIEVEIAQV